MRRSMLLGIVAVVIAGMLPGIPSAMAGPTGEDTNALGTMSWLPSNANEMAQVPSGASRLVVLYDHSTSATGQVEALLAKGPFGAKFFTASVADARMIAHSPFIKSLEQRTARPEIGPVDQAFMGISGDVRDGACSKVGTPAFSAAYSTTRTLFSVQPYEPILAPGACELINSETPVDGGYSTTITTFVPGFWMDVSWPTRPVTAPGVGPITAGHVAGNLFYGAFYDSEGQNGEFYQVADATSTSRSIPAPGTYDAIYSFTARPGAIGDPCDGFPDLGPVAAPAGTFDTEVVSVPSGSTKVTFSLFPTSDWDLVVFDPSPTPAKGTSGNNPLSEETIVVPDLSPGTTPAKIKTLVPGNFQMHACNYAGEPTVIGAVRIER